MNAFGKKPAFLAILLLAALPSFAFDWGIELSNEAGIDFGDDSQWYTDNQAALFGVPARYDLVHVVNREKPLEEVLLAAGAGKAMGDVSDMAQALNQAGLVSHQFGVSVEETVGTMVFAVPIMTIEPLRDKLREGMQFDLMAIG